jgi:hypothetical protein
MNSERVRKHDSYSSRDKEVTVLHGDLPWEEVQFLDR